MEGGCPEDVRRVSGDVLALTRVVMRGMRTGMAGSPTARTLDLLRREQWPLVQVVERWCAFSRRRVDLFGVFDLLAACHDPLDAIVRSGGPHVPSPGVPVAGRTLDHPAAELPAGAKPEPVTASVRSLLSGGSGICGIQVTSASCLAARRAKLLASPAVPAWLAAGGQALLLGWVKRRGRWLWAAEVISLSEGGLVAGPRSEWSKPPPKARGVGSPRGADPPVPGGGEA